MLPVLSIDSQIELQSPGQLTGHTLKSSIEGFPGATDNEFFCKSLARAVGLEAASIEMREMGGRRFLTKSAVQPIALERPLSPKVGPQQADEWRAPG